MALVTIHAGIHTPSLAIGVVIGLIIAAVIGVLPVACYCLKRGRRRQGKLPCMQNYY
jgi:hypothetical protein